MYIKSSNVIYNKKPEVVEVKGSSLGFKINDTVRVWCFSFYTERDFLYEKEGNPIGHLLEDFNGIPYISGLDESMEQNYSVFVTDGPAQNIIFTKIE